MSPPSPTAAPAYERDPYRRRLEVEIVRRGEDGERPYVVLDDTVLYPEGGGQPADRGTLDGIPVVDVQRSDGEIRHYLERPIESGGATLELDWGRRWDHMQQHSGQHLLTAVALQRFGWATTGFHLGAETSSIDLDRLPLTDEERSALEEAVVAEIGSGQRISSRRVEHRELEGMLERGEVRSRRLPPGLRGEIRLVEIEGLDVNTCGGTHLATLAELATFKLLESEPAHGGCRLFWVAGDRVRRRLGELEDQLLELRRVFETSAEELPEVARLKLEQLQESRRRADEIEGRWAEALAAELASRPTPARIHLESVDGSFLHRVARSYTGVRQKGALLLTGAGEQGEFFALAHGEETSLDLRRLGPRIAELFEGRGGGAGNVFQGKAGSLVRREEALELLAAALGESGDSP